MGRDSEEDVLRSLASALEAVNKLFKAVVLSRAAYSYLCWLIPVSITVIISSIKPLVGTVYETIILACIWATSIPVILLQFHKASRALEAYARAFRAQGSEECSGRVTSRLIAIGWACAWIVYPLITILLSLPPLSMPKQIIAPLSLIITLSIGVSFTGVWELVCFNCKISLIAASILYATIVMLLLAPTTNYWDIAVGGLFLSYTTAAVLYIHEGLKLVAPREGEG